MSGESIYFCDLTALIFYEFTDSGSKQCSTDQSGSTTYHMNGYRTCKIMETDLR